MTAIIEGSVGGDYRECRGCAGLYFQILYHKVNESFECEENLMTLRMPKASCLQAISAYKTVLGHAFLFCHAWPKGRMSQFDKVQLLNETCTFSCWTEYRTVFVQCKNLPPDKQIRFFLSWYTRFGTRHQDTANVIQHGAQGLSGSVHVWIPRNSTDDEMPWVSDPFPNVENLSPYPAVVPSSYKKIMKSIEIALKESTIILWYIW